MCYGPFSNGYHLLSKVIIQHMYTVFHQTFNMFQCMIVQEISSWNLWCHLLNVISIILTNCLHNYCISYKIYILLQWYVKLGLHAFCLVCVCVAISAYCVGNHTLHVVKKTKTGQPKRNRKEVFISIGERRGNTQIWIIKVFFLILFLTK